MKQNLETKVGIFLLAGIAVICTLIIFFGEVGDLFKPTYNLTVDFANASGVVERALMSTFPGRTSARSPPIPTPYPIPSRWRCG